MSRAIPPRRGQPEVEPDPEGYFADSKSPLTSLIFLLPLLIVYEVGTRQFTTAAQHGRDQQIIAFMWVRQFFWLFGLHAEHLPLIAVIICLLSVQVFERQPWRFHLSTLVGMAAESLLWALPLIGGGWLVAKYLPLMAAPATTRDLVIMSLGAGVYEELVFRLMFFNLLGQMLKDALKLHPGMTHLGVVLSSAVAFSLYHYLSPVEHFLWRTFVFRTAAGVYFGVLFLKRGFGISAASHAAYDILILYL